MKNVKNIAFVEIYADYIYNLCFQIVKDKDIAEKMVFNSFFSLSKNNNLLADKHTLLNFAKQEIKSFLLAENKPFKPIENFSNLFFKDGKWKKEIITDDELPICEKIISILKYELHCKDTEIINTLNISAKAYYNSLYFIRLFYANKNQKK